MRTDNFESLEMPFVKAIFYGEPGSGKTTLAGSATLDPRMAPVLILNCVGNPVSIRRLRPAPTLIHLTSITDIKDIFDWLYGGQDPKGAIPLTFKDKYNIDLPVFKTVVIDQLTGLQGLFMRKHLGNEGKVTNFKKAEFDDWAAILQYMEGVSYNFFEVLQMHVIMTALERVEVDHLTKAQTWGIGLMGQSQQVVPAYSYILARLVRQAKISDTAKKEYKLSDVPYTTAFFDILGRFSAKEQYGMGLRYLETPTMTKILDAMVASDTRTEVGEKKNLTESKG
jgi:hypothetical protein